MYIMCVLKAFNCVLCPLVEDSVSVINRLAEEETGEVCVCYCVCVMCACVCVCYCVCVMYTCVQLSVVS